MILIFLLACSSMALEIYLSAFFSGGVAGNNPNLPAALEAASEANPLLQIVLMAFLKVFLMLVHIVLPFHISVIYEGTEIQKMLGVFLYMIPLVLAALFYLAWRVSGKYKEFFFGLLFSSLPFPRPSRSVSMEE